MFKKSFLIFMLLCSIEDIIGPLCDFYPYYPGSMFPRFSKYCSERCCEGIQTSGDLVCCKKYSNPSPVWLTPVSITLGMVGLCFILSTIIIVVYIIQNKKKNLVIHPAYSNSYQTAISTASTSYPSYINYGLPQPSAPPQSARIVRPPSYEQFYRQPTIIALSSDNQLPVLPASVKIN